MKHGLQFLSTPFTLFFVSFLFFISISIQAQNSSSGINLNSTKNVESNMAVPDYPAFAILNIHPSNILRPNSPHDIGTIVSNNFSNGPIIPNSFAFEMAPAMILWPNITLSEFQSKSIWDFIGQTRISLATSSADPAGRYASAGLRITLLDETDPRASKDFTRILFDLANRITDIEADCPKLTWDAMGITPEIYESDRVKKEQADSLIALCKAGKEAGLDTSIIQARKDWEEQHWNAPLFEFASSIRLYSPDSLWKHMRSDAFAVWVTYASGFGSISQFIVSSKIGSEHTDNAWNGLVGSLSAYLSIGRHDYRVFGEVSTQTALKEITQHSPRFPAQLGISIHISDDLWMNGTLGVRYQTGLPAEFFKSIDFSLTPIH